MRIGVIGAGFTGLSAAYFLAKSGHTVTILERESHPGGLAVGYKEKDWDWTLEKHYHHWFTNDLSVLDLAKEIGHEVVIVRPHTNWYVDGHIYEFDSIPAILRFPPLSLINRLRNLATLAFLRLNPFWKPLEKIHAHTVLPFFMGKRVYKLLWEPLFQNKFGEYANTVSLAWFWARIKKRTQSLVYPIGGFQGFADHLVTTIKKMKGEVYFDVEIQNLKVNKKVLVTLRDSKGKYKKYSFDKVIVTTTSYTFIKMAPQLPTSYKKRALKLKGLGAINIVLRLKKQFFPNNTYWLSIAATTSPLMAIVEHTNFMNKKYYNNEHLVYLGNYLPYDHPYFKKTKKAVLKEYDSFLCRINPKYKKTIIDYKIFKAPFAQPVIPVNYSKLILPFDTPLKNVYLANIQQVYPWDRGTNYAVELGQKIVHDFVI